eukprot:TRINITY_DN10572_c0_g1_i3.p1 TRINITY_DN10572_c0_g1~~TRINITY_DN10572_c0_g1_i3.p1  ORF type:complete len:144 (+),score=34.88 TRINITY_DN10572_c0_g1_i3:968-1399(+)
MLTLEDEQIKCHLLYGLKNFSSASDESTRQILKLMNVQLLVLHLAYGNSEIVSYTVQTLGNICAGPTEDVSSVIEAECLPLLQQLLNSSQNASLQKEICWTLSNITSGPETHIELLINSGIIEDLCDIVIKSPYKNVRFSIEG